MLPIVPLFLLAAESSNAPPLATDSAPIALTQQAAATSPDAKTGVESKSTADRLSFEAQGRLRGESTFDQPSGEDRHRGRLRLRVGGAYELLDSVTVRARLSTLSDGRDANNPHWDFGDGSNSFEAAEFGLDRFYFDWAPGENWQVQVGKFGHSFARPAVFGELMWDDDVQPTGAAVKWTPAPMDSSRFDVRAVEYIAVENASANDTSMFGLQGNFFHDLDEDISLQVSSSITSWSAEGDALATSNQGSDLGADFTIWEGFVSGRYNHGERKSTTAFLQFMSNLDDDFSEDNGFVVGAQYGASGKKKDINFFGAYYTVDANAVFSPVSQDDTPIAGSGIGTGMDGLVGGSQYFISDTFSVRLWFLTSNADAAEDPLRVRLDFDFTVK